MAEAERRLAMEQAEGRGRLTGLRQTLYGAATRQMLASARVGPGDRVLDIAAGTGDQSRLAARLVGPAGSVLATDISREMLDVAARLAQQEGLTNITTQVMNAERLDLPENSYDAVISRFGLMLVERKHQALTEIWRVLKPGGRLAALVWSRPERNPLFTLSDTLVAQFSHAEGSEGTESHPFSLADSGIFADTLAKAGFQEVQVQVMPATFHFPSFDVLAAWWGRQFDEALARLAPEPRQQLLEQARQAVREFEAAEGIQAPAELLLGIGMK